MLAKYFLLITLLSINYSFACDIVGASACTHKPENDLKEENFEKYCSTYKEHIECVYGKYKGCDKKEKYASAMESMVKGLKKKAKQIIELCDIEINLPDVTKKPKPTEPTDDYDEEEAPEEEEEEETNPKKKKKRKKLRRTTTRKSTGPPCKISTIPIDCHPLLTNIQFVATWNGIQKQKWCNQATSYYFCIKARMANCIGVQYMESLSYYEKVEKYIHSQSNLNCPGGVEGCAANPNDIRCKLGVRYGETNSSSKIHNKIYNLFLLSFCILVFNICK